MALHPVYQIATETLADSYGVAKVDVSKGLNELNTFDQVLIWASSPIAMDSYDLGLASLHRNSSPWQ